MRFSSIWALGELEYQLSPNFGRHGTRVGNDIKRSKRTDSVKQVTTGGLLDDMHGGGLSYFKFGYS